MSGIVFDAMSGVKKLEEYPAAINCTTLANEPSNGDGRRLTPLLVQNLVNKLPIPSFGAIAYFHIL